MSLSRADIITAFAPRESGNDSHEERSIGALLIDASKLTPDGAERILRKEINAQVHADLLANLKQELK